MLILRIFISSIFFKFFAFYFASVYFLSIQCYRVYIDGSEMTSIWLFLKIVGYICFFYTRKVCRLFSALFFLGTLAPNEISLLYYSYYKFQRVKIPRKKLLVSQLLLTLSPLPAGDCCLTGLSQKSRS